MLIMILAMPMVLNLLSVAGDILKQHQVMHQIPRVLTLHGAQTEKTMEPKLQLVRERRIQKFFSLNQSQRILELRLMHLNIMMQLRPVPTMVTIQTMTTGSCQAYMN